MPRRVHTLTRALAISLALIQLVLGTAHATSTGNRDGGDTGDAIRLMSAARESPADLSSPDPGPTMVRVGSGGPVIREAPTDLSRSLTGLFYDTYLPVISQRLDSKGATWYRVQLWGSLFGWIRADQTELGDPPVKVDNTATPVVPAGSGPSRSSRGNLFTLATNGVTRDRYVLRSAPGIGSDPVGILEPASPVTVQAWQADDQGSIWYRIQTSDQSGWVWGGGVDLTATDHSSFGNDGNPLARAISGKGMWLTVRLLDLADPIEIVVAAKNLGLTHVYLEAGSSTGGFYGQGKADHFLSIAHAAGLKVVGWVLTSLDWVSTDVNLCSTVALYRTPLGDTFDGVAPDIEINMNDDDARTFSEILRAEIGSDHLIVGVIFPAGSWIGQRHPLARVLSRSFDVIAPMAYWHDSQSEFAAEDVSTFVARSIRDVRASIGNERFPVEVIAQGYDTFARDGIGPSNPNRAETAAALVAARDHGASGVSLFQWGTTTPSEWEALEAFEWPHLN